ncbi:MAG TPA: gliding-motility protein MglA [Kofleriaceae bacterium]|nr:gliding-motility protein MglA [Kofleriaceae bacterium]
MAQVDTRERQLTIKLVYYGPALSGKTTNLRCIHSRVDELNRGRLMTLDTRDDRTLFFDLLPIFFKSSNLSFRVKVYTVPGQPMHEATRRIVLKGADGIAFIADARRSEVAANNQSYQDLMASMDELGIDRARVPSVVQFNKCDLPDIVSPGEVGAFGNSDGEPTFRSCALTGEGVMETFFGLLEASWRSLNANLNLERLFGIRQADFLASMHEHMDLGRSRVRGADNG